MTVTPRPGAEQAGSRGARALLGTFLGLALPAAALADTVACHLTYGGETQVLTARPTASPYHVPTVAIGSYFHFRIVFQDTPPDTAAVKIYTFGERDGGPVPIHQATYPYPALSRAGAPAGFTGLQAVHEPMRDGELQYWCRLQPSAEARP